MQQWSQPFEHQLKDDATYTADLETNHGTITIELYPEDARRRSTTSSASRAKAFTTARCSTGSSRLRGAGRRPDRPGMGGPATSSMMSESSRTTKPHRGDGERRANTNGSQFFIVLQTCRGLPKNYTIFGKVTSGMDVVNTIGDQQVARSRSGEVRRGRNGRVKKVTVNEK